MHITVYGDSILKGVRLEDRRYVIDREWEQQFSLLFGWEITNRSRFGCTLSKGLSLMRRDLERSSESGLAVLEFGGNDCDHDWASISSDPEGEHTSKTSPEAFYALYREAIALVRRHGMTPLVLTLPPIHSEAYLSFICRNGLSRGSILRWMGDAERISRWQESFSDLAARAAYAEGARLIDLRAAFPKEQDLIRPLVCDDGIHPSRLGQWLIFRTLCECAGISAAG